MGIKSFIKSFTVDIKQWLNKYKESLVELFTSLKQFFMIDLWKINIKEQRPLHYYLKIAAITAGLTSKEKNRGLVKFRLGNYSAALSYFTVLAVIPFIAAIFFITKGLGIDGYLEEKLILLSLIENQEILDIVINLANNIIDSSRNGLFGAVSFLIFIWAIIWLIINIEKAFDDIWQVEKMRGFGKQLLYYVGFLIISPFILLLFMSLMVFVNHALGHYGVKIWYFETINGFMQWLMYYGVSVIALTIINKSIPNAKVRWGAAFKSSVITGFAFVLVQFLYTSTQLMVSRLNAVYGVFAAFPLFLIWLNISWTIILIGAKLTYAIQVEDLKKLEAEQNE